MSAFLRLQAVVLLLLQAVLILANRMLAFMMIRPRMPSLIILVVAIVPLPKLSAMVPWPLFAVRSFITQFSYPTPHLTNNHPQLVPTVVLE
jgi:hypothetical protein